MLCAVWVVGPQDREGRSDVGTYDWLKILTPVFLGGGVTWQFVKWLWKKMAEWRGRPKPRAIEIIPTRFRVNLNSSVPDMSVELVVVNYTDEPMHLTTLKVQWIQFGSAQTVKDIGKTHVDIPARSSKAVSCYRELTDAYAAEMRRMGPPYGVMSVYENSNLIVEYEGTVGKRRLPHHVIHQLQVPSGVMVGMPYTLVKDSTTWRRFSWRGPGTSPADWLKVGNVYEGQVMLQSLEQAKVTVMIRRAGPNSETMYVPIELLGDVGPVK